jgi:AcrR family transcriptional regulator
MSVGETKSPWANQSRRKRGKQFDVKRDAVLVAAASLFRRYGYNGASLADLAEMLNITKPTLYYYVGSKEQLFSEVVTLAQKRILQSMTSTVDKDLTAIEKLRIIMLDYAELVSSDDGSLSLFIENADLSGELRRTFQAKSREANALIYKVLAEGKADGTLRVDDSTIFLHTLFGSLNWIPRWFKPTGRLSIKKVAEAQVDLLLDGVRGPAAKPSLASEAT